MESLLRDIGLDKVKKHTGRKGSNFMFCCPFHGEKRPSAGIVVTHDGGYGQCYSCDETFSLVKLVGHVLGLNFPDAKSWLEERYNVDFREFSSDETRRIKRYEEYFEIQEKSGEKIRHELPRVELAPFRSGKETHKYFFERGFDFNDVQRHMVGWDRVRKRVTIPIFHPDGVLAGFTGRAVLEPKRKGRPNPKYIKAYGSLPKYYIYDNFPIGEVLYGSHDFKADDGTALIVEGPLDIMWLHKLGFNNVLCTIVAKMSMDKKTGFSTQKEIMMQLGVKKVIFMQDNDDAGRVGKKLANEILSPDIVCYDTEYPDEWNDPVGMSRKQIETMLSNKHRYGKTKLRRI